jgi:hypothetical protein
MTKPPIKKQALPGITSKTCRIRLRYTGYFITYLWPEILFAARSAVRKGGGRKYNHPGATRHPSEGGELSHTMTDRNGQDRAIACRVLIPLLRRGGAQRRGGSQVGGLARQLSVVSAANEASHRQRTEAEGGFAFCLRLLPLSAQHFADANSVSFAARTL